MPAIWRIILTIYNLLLLLLAAAAITVSVGITQPLHYINLLASSPENRIICGTVGIVVFFLALILIYFGLRRGRNEDQVLVDKSLLGEVFISIDAVKLIIMKAVRQIDGVKDIRPYVKNGPAGLSIVLEMMINPTVSVPELSSSTQKIVKEHLENIGGLQIAEIKVRFDDFNAGK